MSQGNAYKLLMPKATAIWLVRNTQLTHDQVAQSCGLHALEVKMLERESFQGENPLLNGQLTEEELRRCEADSGAVLSFQNPLGGLKLAQKKEKRYTPVAYRQDRPRAVLWFVKKHPEIPDTALVSFLNTTLKTIQSVRDGTHRLLSELKPGHPVLLGLCTQEKLDALLSLYPVDKAL